MSGVKKNKTAKLSEHAIDELVVSQADNELAWEPSIRVKKPKATSVSISSELAGRAAFLASLHREKGLDEWVERVVRERVELEELALSRAKKELAS
jgi:hypothetical protein